MIRTRLQVAGAPGRWLDELAAAVCQGCYGELALLVNIGVWPDLAGLVGRCEAFVGAAAGEDSLILGILAADEDRPALPQGLEAAGAWAFTRHAALAWAPRGVRLNMIGLCAGPPADPDPDPDPVIRGRSSAPVHAPPASIEDVVRTIHAMAGWRSMTGQFVRLGGV